MITEPVITTIENLTITKDVETNEHGDNFVRVRIDFLRPEDNRVVTISDQRIAMPTEMDDFTPRSALIAAWLGLGLFIPLTARTEVLSEYGLSRSGFQVTKYAIEIAHAYNVLTNGGDITEAI